MAKRRTFTPEFKAEVVLEVLSGATSQKEFEKISKQDNYTLYTRFIRISTIKELSLHRYH